MKILILSRNRFLYSTRRLARAASERGHGVIVADPLACRLELVGEVMRLFCKGTPVEGVNCVIPRIGQLTFASALAIVEALEVRAIPSLNSAAAIRLAHDRFAALQVMGQRVAVPRTTRIHHASDIPGAVDSLGGPPLVVKTLAGSQGTGVMLSESEAGLLALCEELLRRDSELLLQEFISNEPARDRRAVVVNGSIVAAMQRQSTASDFRTNFHLGGTVSPCDLSDLEAEMAIKAARASGLAVAGVDLIEGAAGPMVLEVNHSPGLSGIEEATGVDVAAAMVDYAEKIATAD